MSLDLILDAEALVGDWLRGDPAIVALDARVAGRTPKTTTIPWIRVTQLDVTPIRRSPLERVMDYTVQLDCYAGATAMDAHTGQAEANLLARTARAVLVAVQGTVTDGAVVTRVQFTTHQRFPDTDLEPARERVILIANLMMHPN